MRTRSILLSAMTCYAACSAQASTSLEGTWNGALELPGGAELPFEITLNSGMSWSGRISIPAQGLKDFALSDVKAEGSHITFRMDGIPGNPSFDGHLVVDGRIQGFLTQGGQRVPFHVKRAEPCSEPQPARPAGFTERDIQIGHAPWQLAGTLTLPVGKGPFPALVLVHGSGPQDRDERIGASTPFRDLAWGLAKKGVAVLRYEKRTYAHRQACAALDKLTVQEETVSDAASAMASLRSVPDVDPHRVFVLGHSLGGYLLPRIAQAAPEGAGYIALAGSARPMEDLVLEQLRRQNAPGETIAVCEAEVAKIKALDAQRSAAGLLLFAPVSYWLDLKDYEPAREAKQIHKPMLFLQGEADCQVTLVDFGIWQQALSAQKDVAFHRFPGLNHLFMRVTGKSTGAEYGRPGQHMASEVIEEIVRWVLKPGSR